MTRDADNQVHASMPMVCNWCSARFEYIATTTATHTTCPYCKARLWVDPGQVANLVDPRGSGR